MCLAETSFSTSIELSSPVWSLPTPPTTLFLLISLELQSQLFIQANSAKWMNSCLSETLENKNSIFFFYFFIFISCSLPCLPLTFFSSSIPFPGPLAHLSKWQHTLPWQLQGYSVIPWVCACLCVSVFVCLALNAHVASQLPLWVINWDIFCWIYLDSFRFES